MRPHEHYLRSEQLLENSLNLSPSTEELYLRRAQVHATLAQVVEQPKPLVIEMPPGVLNQSETVDYRYLLVKYINHVGECEGTNFLSDHNREYTPPEYKFTDTEWATLRYLQENY